MGAQRSVLDWDDDERRWTVRATVSFARALVSFFDPLYHPVLHEPDVEGAVHAFQAHDIPEGLVPDPGPREDGQRIPHPAHTECRQLAIVCLVQSSVSTARIAPVFFNNHAYLSMLMKYGCAHSLYR